MTQASRMKAVEEFQNGKVKFLIGTDLVGRGLDIHNVRAVINFNFPNEESRYVHRAGRTARAGNVGSCVTITNDDERKHLKRVVKKCSSVAKAYTVNGKTIEYFQKKIDLLGDAIKKIKELEQSERQMDRAYMEASKAENLIQFEDEITNRPKKEWFQTTKMKKEVAEMSKEEVEKAKMKAQMKKDKYIEKIKLTKKNERDNDQAAQKAAKRDIKRSGMDDQYMNKKQIKQAQQTAKKKKE